MSGEASCGAHAAPVSSKATVHPSLDTKDRLKLAAHPFGKYPIERSSLVTFQYPHTVSAPHTRPEVRDCLHPRSVWWLPGSRGCANGQTGLRSLARNVGVRRWHTHMHSPPQSAMHSLRSMYRDGAGVAEGFCGNMQNSGDAGNTIHKGHLGVWPRKHLPCVMDAIGFHAA